MINHFLDCSLIGTDASATEYQFDFCNREFTCPGADLTQAVGIFTEKTGDSLACASLGTYDSYTIDSTDTGHDLKFTIKNACGTEANLDQIVTFRLTCDMNAGSRTPFSVVKNESCDKILETVTIDACDLNYVPALNFNINLSSGSILKDIIKNSLIFFLCIILPLYVVLLITRWRAAEKMKNKRYLELRKKQAV